MRPVASRLEARDPQISGDGDASAFEAELGPLLSDAVRLAVGILLNSVDAEDAVQEACLRAWSRRANRHAGTKLRPWFLGIVANQCREVKRSSWWSVLRLADLTTTTEVTPQDTATTLDLRRALARTPHRRREMLVLRYYLDLSFEDVAAVTGCSVDAAKAVVRRGTADLKRLMSISEATP